MRLRYQPGRDDHVAYKCSGWKFTVHLKPRTQFLFPCKCNPPSSSHRAVSTETKVNVSVSVTVESRVCNVTPTSHNKLQLLGSVIVNNVGYYSLSLQDLHVSSIFVFSFSIR